MEWNEEIGVPITEEIHGYLDKAIKIAKNKAQLAKILGLNDNVIKTWLGGGSQIGKYIGWAHWRIIRGYLVANKLIDGNDPRWLTPSEMRERLANGALSRLPDDERQLLELFRLLTEDGKLAALATLKGLSNTFNKDAQTSAQSSTA